MRNQVLIGDALAQLGRVPDGVIQCCVTSPPYFGLRDYGIEGQLGLEPDHKEYIARLVEIFGQVRRTLRADGTLWLNLGDSYANNGKRGGVTSGRHARKLHGESKTRRAQRQTGFKAKELMMIPARVALALQEDGWYLRSDIIWAKGNPMPESVADRPTRSHEYVFLLTKSPRYFYDAAAIKEPANGTNHHDVTGGGHAPPGQSAHSGTRSRKSVELTRNKRSVWTINPRPYKGAHFAVMPEELARLCIRAGSGPGTLVLDPFAGSGTTLGVACSLGRDYLGIELNEAFLPLIEGRLERAREIRSEQEMLAFAMDREVVF